MDFRHVEKMITADGWKLIRIAGSHYQYKKESVPYNVTLPNHGSKSISIGVIKNLEKITGLSLRRQIGYFFYKNFSLLIYLLTFEQ